MNQRITCLRLTLALGLFLSALHAQNYNVDWYKVAGGGGASTNGVYTLSGALGQPDASGAMTGGNYSLTGGFWSLSAVPTPGAPGLTITYAGLQAIVAWSPSVTGWTLQTNANLATAAWGNYAGAIVSNSATISAPMVKLFFRLSQP
jgi:hypothetical protein